MRRFTIKRTLIVLSFLLTIFAVTFIVSQWQFESDLESLSIGFNDFPDGYHESLNAGRASDNSLEFDYVSWPEDPDTHSIIPKIIHFIWFKDLYSHHLDVTNMPHIGSASPEECHRSNKDFEVITWNATAARDLLESHYAWFLPTYDSYPYPIQRVDAFKYFALWHYGGIYMDMDVTCRRSLTPLLAFPAWFPKATLVGVNNDVMAAHRYHPLIGEMTKRLKGRNHNLFFPYLTIYWSTGPQFASDLLQEWYTRFKDTWSSDDKPCPDGNPCPDGDAVYVLPLPFYSEEFTFFGHRPGGTWHGGDVAVILWIVQRPWILALGILPIFMTIWLVIRTRRNSRKKSALTENSFKEWDGES